jgi:quercetin dioxygenase-like cupin family protein
MRGVRRCRTRGVALFLSVVALMVGGSITLQTHSTAVAQDATPAASEMAPQGVTFEPIGYVPNVTLPSPAELTAARVGFDRGAGFPFDASDPTGAMVVVESGTLTIRVVEQSWTISRGAALQQAMATPAAEPTMTGVVEQVTTGQEATLQAGDAAFIPGSVNGEARNRGTEHAEGLVILIAPAGMGAMASSAATPAS